MKPKIETGGRKRRTKTAGKEDIVASTSKDATQSKITRRSGKETTEEQETSTSESEFESDSSPKECEISNPSNLPTCDPMKCAMEELVECRAITGAKRARRCVGKGFVSYPLTCKGCSCTMAHEEWRQKRQSANHKYYKEHTKKYRKSRAKGQRIAPPPKEAYDLNRRSGSEDTKKERGSIMKSSRGNRRKALALAPKDQDADYACEIANPQNLASCVPAHCATASGVSCGIDKVRNMCFAYGFASQAVCHGCSCQMTLEEKRRRNNESLKRYRARAKTMKERIADGTFEGKIEDEERPKRKWRPLGPPPVITLKQQPELEFGWNRFRDSGEKR